MSSQRETKGILHTLHSGSTFRLKKAEDPENQVEVLIIFYPQNDYLDPKGAVAELRCADKTLSWELVIDRCRRNIEELQTAHTFDYVVILKRQHYGNNLSFATCLVGSELGQVSTFAAKPNHSAKMQPERCVYGRWGSHLAIQRKPTDIIFNVGMDMLNPNPLPFPTNTSNIEAKKSGSRRANTSDVQVAKLVSTNSDLNTSRSISVQTSTSHNLHNIIDQLEATRIFFCGVVAEDDFIATCLEAKINLGKSIAIIYDACAGFSKDDVKAARRSRIKLVRTQMVLSSLSNNAAKIRSKIEKLNALFPKDISLLPSVKDTITIMDMVRFRQHQRRSKCTQYSELPLPCADLIRSACSSLSHLYSSDVKLGKSSFHIMCASGDLDLLREVIKYLGAENIDFSRKTEDGRSETPLMLATKEGHVSLAKFLLEAAKEAGSPPLSNDKDNFGRTALMIAAAYGHVKIVKLLLKRGSCHVMAIDKHGYTALHYCSAGFPGTRRHMQIIRLLLAAAGTVYSRHVLLQIVDNRGWSALHLMSKNGILLPSFPWDLFASDYSGLPFQLMTKDGFSLVHLAAWNGHDLVVRLLCSQKTFLSDDYKIQFSISSEKFVSSHTEMRDPQILENRSHAWIHTRSNNYKRAPWVDRMPKNMPTPIKNLLELDSCLIRGYTNTAIWLVRAGYVGGPNLPQDDVDAFFHRIILHGDLQSFLSIVQSPMNITLNKRLISIISSLDSFPHDSGDFTTKFRQWVPSPIDASMESLTARRMSITSPKNSYSLVYSLSQLAHDSWARQTCEGAPLVVQKGASLLESTLTVPFGLMPSSKQKQIVKMVQLTLDCIEILGFSINNLDLVESRLCIDFDENGFGFINQSKGTDQTMGMLEKLRRESLAVEKKRHNLYESARRTSLVLENSMHGDLPSSNDLRLLMETLTMNLHDTWAKKKKLAGWVYGSYRDYSLNQEIDNHSNKSTGSTTGRKFDERLVPFDYLMGPYKARCRTTVQTIIETISNLGGGFTKRDKNMKALIHARQQFSISMMSNIAELNSSTSIDEVRQIMLDKLLHRAVGENNIKAVRELLNPASNGENRASTDALDANGRSVIHTAVLHGHVEPLKELLIAGANVGSRDQHGITPLMIAAFLGYSKVVELLLRQGASTVSRDNHGWAAIHFAAYSNHATIIGQLSRDLTSPGRPGVDFFAIDWLKVATNDLKSKKKIKYILTPMTLAVQRLSLEAVLSLINNGSDPTIIDDTGISSYDRALLMADELTMKIEDLDEKISALQGVLLGFSAKQTAISCLKKFVCVYCRNTNRVNEMKDKGDEISHMNSIVYMSHANVEKLAETVRRTRMTMEVIHNHQKNMQKISELRKSLYKRYATVSKVIAMHIQSGPVSASRRRFASILFLKQFISYFVTLLFVLIFSPLDISSGYRMVDVHSSVKYMKNQLSAFAMVSQAGWSEWINNQETLFLGLQVGENGTIKNATTSAYPFGQFHEVDISEFKIVGGLKIQAYESGGKSLYSGSLFRYNNDGFHEYLNGDNVLKHYISLKTREQTRLDFSSVHNLLSGRVGKQIRKVENAASFYSSQLEVLLHARFTLSFYPTGEVKSNLDIFGCLLPLYSNWDGWTDWSHRFAPSKTFELAYTLLLCIRILQLYGSYRIVRAPFIQWVHGKLFIIGREILTLAIIIYDVVSARPLRAEVMESLLGNPTTDFTDSISAYISGQSILNDLLAVQLLTIFVPLLLSLRLIPSFGPNLVAVFGAMINRTVLIYMLVLLCIMLIFSLAFMILLSTDSHHYGSVSAAFLELFKLSFAEEFDNIDSVHEGRIPLATTIYSNVYLGLLLVLFSIFIGIVSDTYLRSLRRSMNNWELLITSEMESDRRKTRLRRVLKKPHGNWHRCATKTFSSCSYCYERIVHTIFEKNNFSKFNSTLWTNAVQNVMVQTRILGKDVARELAEHEKAKIMKTTKGKLHQLFGTSAHLDACTVHRDDSRDLTLLKTSGDLLVDPLQSSNDTLEKHTKQLLRVTEKVGELQSIMSSKNSKMQQTTAPKPPQSSPPVVPSVRRVQTPWYNSSLLHRSIR